MNEMITAMAIKKSQIDLQYACQFDLYSWTKKNDPRMITDIEGTRLACFVLVETSGGTGTDRCHT